ncbi:MAG: O-methyltransferase [Eubacterium sp.]
MIVNERIITYMHSLEHTNSSLLEQIEKSAHEENIPIIRKEMESFLRVMLLINKPHKILELGTAVGYSAILMSEYMPHECTITTIENYEKRIIQAKENIKKAYRGEDIKLLEGDALDIMKRLDDEYDFVFMDAAKAQYINFLPEVKRLLKSGGILISDNVLQEGSLIESRFVTPRRDRTIHARMREYLYSIKNDEELETTIVPIGDGITISVKL